MKWEYYKTFLYTNRESRWLKVLNELGDERWELVTIEKIDGYAIAFLKRPKDTSDE